MAYKINFFGWCSDDGHDKIWGYVTFYDDHREEEVYNFWGRRNGKLSFKDLSDIPFWERKEYCEKKYQEKCRIRRSGTYKKIPVDQIENVFTNFYDEFEKQLVFAKLFDSFRGKKEDQY